VVENLVVTTIYRNTPLGTPGGKIYTLNLDRRQITGQCDIIIPPHAELNPNPRGGMRGGRGIAATAEQLFIANYSVIYCFDRNWQTVRTITHPACANIHDILLYNGHLWVNSTVNDIIVEFNLQGEIQGLINVQKMPEVKPLTGQRRSNLLPDDQILAGQVDFRRPKALKRGIYDWLHVNSMCFLPNGDMVIMLGLVGNFSYNAILDLKTWLQKRGVWPYLVGLNQRLIRTLRLKPAMNTQLIANTTFGQAALLRLDKNHQASIPLVLPKVHIPIHSLLANPDNTILFDDSSSGEIVHFDPINSRQLARIKVTDSFLRGLTRLTDDLIVVGAGSEICLFNLPRQQVVTRITVSDIPDEVVYDIKILPAGFEPVPDTLP